MTSWVFKYQSIEHRMILSSGIISWLKEKSSGNISIRRPVTTHIPVGTVSSAPLSCTEKRRRVNIRKMHDVTSASTLTGKRQTPLWHCAGGDGWQAAPSEWEQQGVATLLRNPVTDGGDGHGPFSVMFSNEVGSGWNVRTVTSFRDCGAFTRMFASAVGGGRTIKENIRGALWGDKHGANSGPQLKGKFPGNKMEPVKIQLYDSV